MLRRTMWMACYGSIGAAVLALTLSAALADDAKPSAKSGDGAEAVQELVISPRAIEQPLMKYRLLPAEYELHDGNAAPILLRLPWEQAPYFTKVVPTFSEYLDVPLDSPKLHGNEIFAFYRVLKRAAFRRTADWQYPIGEEPVGEILIPDVQGGRSIVGYGLSVWIRQRLAAGDLERAREGILVGLAVSRHYARTPFIINQLVCVAIDKQLISRLAELVSQPNSPNLYWAVTQLPRPFVNLRPASELEQRFLPMTIGGLEDLDRKRTEDEWSRLASAILGWFHDAANSKRLDQAAEQKLQERIAKRARVDLPRWIEGGAPKVAAMSEAEVTARWLSHRDDELSQETTAIMALDPRSAIPRLRALQERTTEFHSILGTHTQNWSLHNSYFAAHGVDRQFDAMRIVEALRHYAAGHESRLPESLDKITDVPIPNDPFTGKPFHYELKDGVASLTADVISPPGANKETAGVHYRIKIRK